MKNLTLIITMFTFLFCFSQKKEEKEIVYLLFDKQSKEKCIVEDGSGNSLKSNKFRKEFQDNHIYFRICDEIFTAHKTKSFKDTCSIKALENIKLVNIKYLKDKYNSSYNFKHHVFKKIYFIEKLPNNKIIKYEVGWNDEIMMIDD